MNYKLFTVFFLLLSLKSSYAMEIEEEREAKKAKAEPKVEQYYQPKTLHRLVHKSLAKWLFPHLLEGNIQAVINEIKDLEKYQANVEKIESLIKKEFFDKYLFTLMKNSNPVAYDLKYSTGTQAFSPNSKYIASGATDGTLWLRATKDINTVIPLEVHTNSLTAVAFSSNGKYIVAGSKNGNLLLLDINDLNNLATSANIQSYLLEDHTDRVTSIAFSPDSKYILTGSEDTTAQLWDISNLNSIQSYPLKGHTKEITAVAFSSDGKYALTGSLDNTAKLWDITNTHAIIFRFLIEHADGVTSIAFSPNSKYAVTGSRDCTAKVLDLENLYTTLPFTLKGHTGTVTAVAISPDSKYILTGSRDHTARLWDVGSLGYSRPYSLRGYLPWSKSIALTGHKGAILSVGFSPNGKYAVTGSADGTARVWDITDLPNTPNFTLKAAGWDITAQFSSNNRYILTTHAGSTASKLWDLNDNRLPLGQIAMCVREAEEKKNSFCLVQ
jgi:WD40 repeat protein